MFDEENLMILNDENIGISKIELDESDLMVTSKNGKYCLQVCVRYNWQDINNIKIGVKENIDFNEYVLAENNEPVLIWPSICYVEKISNEKIKFYIEFNNLSYNNLCYMNKRGCFDIDLCSLKVKVYIDYKDVVDNAIIYKF